MRTPTRLSLIMLAAMLPAAADAQAPKPVKTVKIRPSSTTSALFSTAPDGSVLIDWSLVEETAASPDASAADVARMMIAVRDRRWKPMPSQH